MPTATTTTGALDTPFALPGGATIKNRLVKAAMSEQLATVTGAPTEALERLYARWARGGAGMLISGNVMIDRRSIGEPRNVVVEDERDLAALRRWAAAATADDTTAIAQINHPGRQSFVGLSSRVVAPSAVPIDYPGAAKPRALTSEEIVELVARFAETARIVVDAGFDGVQLHGAHGYLISQFLSPAANQRDDEWGGDAERRRRFLLEVTRATRAAIGPDRILAVKLNSSDFQRGGFTEEESLVVSDPAGTSDLRGIDTSLAYDDRKMRPVESRSHVVHLRYATRDIFEAVFEVIETGERLVAIATHWPSRTKGRWRSEPLRIALAENTAFIVRDHVRFDAERYLELKAVGDLAAVQARWEAKVLIMGDLNDEPADRSLVEHLQTSSELDRVAGPTNAIKDFTAEAINYRGDDCFLYNASWKFLAPENTGSYFIDATREEVFANRYQVLDQIIASRGLLDPGGLHLDVDSVQIHNTKTVATQPAGRPRGFDRKTTTGTSDHLPITAILNY